MEGTQLTVRNVSEELAGRLKRLAAERGESVNSLVLELLNGAVGVNARRRRLERYMTGTKEDAEVLERSLREQRVIDEEAWR